MNKYQVALEWLCENSELTQFNINQSQWASETLHELIDRATPKKPKRKLIESEDLWSETATIIEIDICNNCKKQVQNSKKFCDECGQALDWREDEPK